MTRIMVIIFVVATLTGCSNHALTGYNVKMSSGRTHNDDGSSSFYTGGSIDAHFDVR